jgi:hypothetical protein
MKRFTAGLVVAGLLVASVPALADEHGQGPERRHTPLVTSYAKELQSRSRASASTVNGGEVPTGGGKSLALLWTVVGTVTSVAAAAYYVKTIKKTTEGAPQAR